MARYSIQQLLQMAKQAGFSGPGQIEIVAHALVESGGPPYDSADSDAYNSSSGATGILQFIPATSAGIGLNNPRDPQASFNAAYKLSAQGTNFKDWTPYEPASALDQAMKAVRDVAGSGASETPTGSPGGLSLTKPGSGLLSGSQADSWGIAQGISDAVGNAGSSFAAIGVTLQNSGTLLVGLLIIGTGVGILVWMVLNNTQVGQEIKKGAKFAAMVVPK